MASEETNCVDLERGEVETSECAVGFSLEENKELSDIKDQMENTVTVPIDDAGKRETDVREVQLLVDCTTDLSVSLSGENTATTDLSQDSTSVSTDHEAEKTDTNVGEAQHSRDNTTRADLSGEHTTAKDHDGWRPATYVSVREVQLSGDNTATADQSEPSQPPPSVFYCRDELPTQNEAVNVTGSGANGAPAQPADGQHLTDYLQHVISCLQSASESQSGVQKDHMMISRGELTLLVHQTLATQTMWNYMQQLVQENKTLKQKNQVLMGLVMQAKQPCNGAGKEARKIPTQGQLTEGQVFRFDKCPLLPASSPPSLCLGHEDGGADNSIVEMDGDSLSLQLPSQIGSDGDPPSSSPSGVGGKGASGNVPNIVDTAHGLVGASRMPNIPTADVFEGAQYYSCGLQPQDGAAMASVAVSKEQYDLAVEELEKTKRYIKKLLKDGGISPDTTDELVHLRSKVLELQSENMNLARELESRPSHDTYLQESRMKTAPEQQALLQQKLQKQEGFLKKKDELVAILSEEVNKLRTEIKELKSGAQSQPPSTVGLTALPPIPTVASSSCQTSISACLVPAMTQTEGPLEVMHIKALQKKLEQVTSEKADLERETARIKQQLIQARDNEYGHGLALEKSRAKSFDLEQQLRQANEHRSELGAEITGLNNEIDELRRKAKESDHKRRALENMIEDERKRYSRDEQELLKRIDHVTKEKREASQSRDTLAKLLLAADAAWRGGVLYGTPYAVPNDYATHLSSLQRQNTSPHSAHAMSARSSAPRSTPHSSQAQFQGLIDPSCERPLPGTGRSGGSSRFGDSPSQRQPSGSHYSSFPFGQPSPHAYSHNPHQVSPQLQPSRNVHQRSGGGSTSSSASSSSGRVPKQHPH
ncbi:hypothetical protein BaRGS_00001317 [Batillaria attramentaria]|uniref:Uncharacterized protein n=1 Tax=Batillaria attramentaria TaxID=370345 RepID=A0ABD0M788_9CAEN